MSRTQSDGNRAKISAPKRKSTGGIVVKDSPQQLAYEQAVRDWFAGKTPYQKVLDKDPNLKEYSFRTFLLDLLLGPK